MLELELYSRCLGLMQVVSVLVVLGEVEVKLLHLLLLVNFALHEESDWVSAACPRLHRSVRVFHLVNCYFSCTFKLVQTRV